MDLDRAVDELYGLALAQFLARRGQLAVAAKAAGDKELATAIGALRKPTVSAWAVNQLARQRPQDADRLRALAEDLRAAQQSLAGARMKELAPVRNRLIDELVAATRQVAQEAGVRISAALEREVAATFVAALASATATEAVVSGRLTRALEYAGFGEVDLHEATARPLRVVPDAPGTTRAARGSARAERTAQPPLVQVVPPAPTVPTGPNVPTSPPPPALPTATPEAAPPTSAAAPSPATPEPTEPTPEPTELEPTPAPQLNEAHADLAAAEAALAEAAARRGVLAATLELAETRVATLTRDLQRARTERDTAEGRLAQADADVLAAERTARRARAELAALTSD